MAAKPVSARHQRTCAVEVSPGEVAAGAELTVAVAVWCPHGCDLRGQCVSIEDRDGAELASRELTEFAGETCVTGAFVLPAPVEAGEYTWRAILAGDERNLHEPAGTAFSFARHPKPRPGLDPGGDFDFPPHCLLHHPISPTIEAGIGNNHPLPSAFGADERVCQEHLCYQPRPALGAHLCFVQSNYQHPP